MKTCKEVKELLLDIPRVELGFYPTPLYKLERLSEKLGVNLYIKREDFSGQSLFGGNKIRKLEYLLGDAKEKGCEYIFTYGATQSNHAMQTVEACRKIGLKPILYLTSIVSPDENDYRSNLLLDKILGAEVHIVELEDGESENDATERSIALGKDHIKKLEAKGHKCYDIPVGGASFVGTLGFIGGYIELNEQLSKIGVKADYIFHSTGTGGTMAGLVAGKKIIGDGTNIISIDVNHHSNSYKHLSAELGNDALELIGEERILSEADFYNDLSYYYPGYEKPNEKSTEAIKIMGENEGLLLDPVYTGKGFAGLIDYVRKGKVPNGSNVVFIHTGGATALFAEKEIVGDLL